MKGQGAFLTLYDGLSYKLIKPYVHGLVMTEAYTDAVAKDLDWANVSVSCDRRERVLHVALKPV